MISSKKILFLDSTLHKKDATGITLSNLFGGFSKHNLYMIGTCDKIELSRQSGYSNFFTLGENELKHRFPLGIIKSLFLKFGKNKKIKKQTFVQPNLIEVNLSNGTKFSLSKVILSKLLSLFKALGLHHYFLKVDLSRNLEKWIQDVKPDYLYVLLSSRPSIHFANQICEKFDIPLIVHIMDDWPAMIGGDNIFPKFWNTKINNEFKALLKKSSKQFAISEKMATEYNLCFGGDWKYFHNAVDIAFWGSKTKISYFNSDNFVILYSGRLNIGLIETLEIIAKCVEKLSVINGINITFQIQSKTPPVWINNYSKTIFTNYTDYDKLPDLFSSADLLLLPYDFEGKNYDFIRLSMPAKIPEYMISGTPILVVAPSNTALAEYALNYEWGYLLTSNSERKIINSLEYLYTNPGVRENIGKRAYEIAKKRHEITQIQKLFQVNFL